jgi:hypothetical protein
MRLKQKELLDKARGSPYSSIPFFSSNLQDTRIELRVDPETGFCHQIIED